MRPTKEEEEKEFLEASYKRFGRVAQEIISDDFFNNSDFYRFCRIKNLFEIYSEMLSYQPFITILKYYSLRSPNKSKILKDLFKFIRNVLSHFPFYDSWDEVWINKNIVNWNKPGQTIDKFLNNNEGQKSIALILKTSETYMEFQITFPRKYNEGTKIWLKDILSEKEGVLFSVFMMKDLLDTQWGNH